MDLDEMMHRFGWVATRAQLLHEGLTPGAIAYAVGHGHLIRLRRAWYGTTLTPRDRRTAVMLGGRLGGMSAARSYGFWAEGPPTTVHVSWHPHGNVAKPGRRMLYPSTHDIAGLRIVPHWRRTNEPADPWRESVLETLSQVALSETPATAVAVIDSALHCRAIDSNMLSATLARLPRRVAALSSLLDGDSDSGIESRVRIALAHRGVPTRVHPICAGWEVDLLVGDSLVIETDGAAFHSSAEQMERDRRRDADLQRRGYIVVRLSYLQVMTDLDSCIALILEHIARDDHLRPLR